jgi:DNA-binding NarL/FixJ family response regulator
MRTGGSGYLLKDTAGEELLIAIQEVLNGRVYVTSTLAEPVRRALHARRKDSSSASGRLTPRQREVLQLMAEGCTPKEIATLLKVSTRTVEFHKYRIMDILGLRSVAELAAYAVKSRLVI